MPYFGTPEGARRYEYERSQRKKKVINFGNTSEQIISRHLATIAKLKQKINDLELELAEAKAPTKKVYCKVKE